MKRIIRALVMGLLIGGTLAVLYYNRLWPFQGNDTRNVSLETASGKSWAKPLNLPGLPNGFRVSDDLYRGAQPTPEGLAELRKLGVKTIISLRDENDDTALAGSGDFKLVHIPLSALRSPTDQDVRKFLEVFSDSRNLPAFVHCRAGADRTGTMCAVYRIVRQGWDKQTAIDEMIYGGFNFHWEFRNLINYLKKTDYGKFMGPASAPATESVSQIPQDGLSCPLQ